MCRCHVNHERSQNVWFRVLFPFKPIEKRMTTIGPMIVGESRQHLQGGPKSKPLPNDQKIVLNHITACQWNNIYSSN